MEIEWSNGVVEVIKIVLGCFFAMRLLSKQIKSVRTIGKFGKFLLWTIVYGIILFFAKRLFYDPVKQLLFVTVTCELVLFIANCGRTVFVILAVVAIAITFIVILGRKMGDTPVAFFTRFWCVESSICLSEGKARKRGACCTEPGGQAPD